jgi:hypothetical protein
MRRERNKQAAARCRKRRLDHTMALQQVIIMPALFVETIANFVFFIPSIGNGVVGRQETNLAE